MSVEPFGKDDSARFGAARAADRGDLTAPHEEVSAMVKVLYAAEEDKFTSMGRQMGRWVDQVLGPGFQRYCHADSWKPAINLCEYETFYCLIVDLAGVKADEIDLRAEEDVLILTGQRAMPVEPDETGEVRVHLMEIDQGRFLRAVELPQSVDIEAIEAFYRNGYLWVRIPKTP
jgi:HSP20 family protein